MRLTSKKLRASANGQDVPRAIAETHEALIRAGILTVKGAA